MVGFDLGFRSKDKVARGFAFLGFIRCVATYCTCKQTPSSDLVFASFLSPETRWLLTSTWDTLTCDHVVCLSEVSQGANGKNS